MARLREERVRRVIEPRILGDAPTADLPSDDCGDVRDLGLIRDDRGGVAPANPIYAEVMARTLIWNAQADITRRHPEHGVPRYLKGGGLDMGSAVGRGGRGAGARHLERKPREGAPRQSPAGRGARNTTTAAPRPAWGPTPPLL
jgi:hypothetical protein